jgi:AbrB family looped-hinge helix DNA binding protein
MQREGALLLRRKATVSTEGPIVLPASIRRQDGIRAGQAFEVERTADGALRLVRIVPFRRCRDPATGAAFERPDRAAGHVSPHRGDA